MFPSIQDDTNCFDSFDYKWCDIVIFNILSVNMSFKFTFNYYDVICLNDMFLCFHFCVIDDSWDRVLGFDNLC